MPRLRRLIATIALIVAPVTLLWAGALYLSGGFNFVVLGARITAHDVWRPLIAGAVAAAAYVWLAGPSHVRGRVALIVDRLPRARLDPRVYAVVLATAVSAAGMKWTSITVGGADSYGYASEADMWRRGEFVLSQPWVAAVPWPEADRSFTPLGFHPGQQPHTIVPTYSPGLPMLMALAKSVAGQCGLFFVVPLSAGIAVLATFGLGGRLATPAAGLSAAWLLATSPVFLYMLMQPMSDVPTAAAWVVAFWCAMGSSVSSAAGCGIATAIAVLLRPNLAPMALLLPGWQWLLAWRRHGEERRRLLWRGLAMLLFIAPAFATVGWLNQVWNGSPLRAGYGPFRDLFAWENVKPNVIRYAQWFAQTQTPIPFAGIAALFLARRRLWPAAELSGVVVAGVFVIAVWVEYCIYVPFDDWWYLRFLLPCWPFIMIGLAALIAAAARRFERPMVTAAAAAVVMALGAFGLRQAFRDDYFGGMRGGEIKYAVAGEIVRRYTEPSAVILSGMHSGSLRYYAGRMTISFSSLNRAWIDRAVRWLDAHGSHPYALLEYWELDEFRTRFDPDNTIGKLEMRPMIEYRGEPTMYLFDLLRPVNSQEPTLLHPAVEISTCRPPVPAPRVRFRE